MLFEDFADQAQHQDEIQEESTSESEISPERTQVADLSSHFSHVLPLEEREDAVQPRREPQLYLCDDWIQPMGVVHKPKELNVKDKMRANVAKNYGAILERYQRCELGGFTFHCPFCSVFLFVPKPAIFQLVTFQYPWFGKTNWPSQGCLSRNMHFHAHTHNMCKTDHSPSKYENEVAQEPKEFKTENFWPHLSFLQCIYSTLTSLVTQTQKIDSRQVVTHLLLKSTTNRTLTRIFECNFVNHLLRCYQVI